METSVQTGEEGDMDGVEESQTYDVERDLYDFSGTPMMDPQEYVGRLRLHPTPQSPPYSPPSALVRNRVFKMRPPINLQLRFPTR